MHTSERSLRLLVEAVKEYAIIMLDPQGHVVSWNAGAQRITGYCADEIIGQSFTRFYTKEDEARNLPQTLLATALEQGSVVNEGWRLRKDGKRFWASVDIAAIRDAAGTLLGFGKVTRDLTEQRKSALQTHTSEERFSTIIEAAPNGFLMVNASGEIVLMNSQIEQIFGYSRDELLGQNIELLVPLEHRGHHPKNREHYHLAPSARAMGVGRDLYGVQKDGQLVPLEIGLNPLTTNEGDYVVASIIDVSARKQVEAALRASEARLNEAQRVAHIGSWELNIDSSDMSWSNEVFNILECDQSHTDATYEAFVAAVHPEDRDSLFDAFQSAVNEHTPYEVVHRLSMKDGRIKYVRERGEVYPQESGPMRAFGTIQDVTALKQAEDELYLLNRELEQRVERRTAELQTTNKQLQQSIIDLNNAQLQLVRSEKMAALGGLVAGIAHEINTPAGVGMTAASHLNSKIEHYLELYRSGDLKRSDLESFFDVAHESCRIIMSNLQRAADLIRSFKQVAVDQTSGEQRVFELKHYIEEVLLSLRPKLKHTRHQVTLNCPEGLLIYSHPGAFSQILTNLIINSLTHGFDEDATGEISIDVSTPPGTLLLRYRDNGKGIPKDHLGKIFDPFFTTKRGQGGSGLGMHVVQNLVTQLLKGTIEISSTPGAGVMFEIWIPRPEQPPAQAPAAQRQAG